MDIEEKREIIIDYLKGLTHYLVISNGNGWGKAQDLKTAIKYAASNSSGNNLKYAVYKAYKDTYIDEIDGAIICPSGCELAVRIGIFNVRGVIQKEEEK